MECFLANNFRLRTLDDFYSYKTNILSKEAKYKVVEFVDTPKTLEEVYQYFLGKLPEDVDKELLRSSLEKLSTEDLNRLYWKNNTREIIRHKWFFEKLDKCFQYEYTTEVNEAIEDDLEQLKDVLIDICYYDHIFYDKYVRSLDETRDVICTIDTDSNFININGFVQDFIKRKGLNDITEVQNMTIVNILINIVTEAIRCTFWLLTGNFGIHDEIRPKIAMKNEFVYQRLLLTRNKKSWISWLITLLNTGKMYIKVYKIH